MSFQSIADYIAVAVLVAIIVLYAYGRRHLDRPGSSATETHGDRRMPHQDAGEIPACDTGPGGKLRFGITGRPAGATTPEQEAAADPVCGMTVAPGRAATADHGGRRYEFCSSGCRDAFVADPDRYLAAPKR